MSRTAEQTVTLFIENGLTLTTVESCTGGKVAADIVSVAGASDMFLQGFVTYSNAAKVRYVGVKQETLDSLGAVSYETAKEMCEGACLMTGTDAGVSTTGIAGPGGGTPEKPVGLVYIGASVKGHTKVLRLNLTGTREEIRCEAAERALQLLIGTTKEALGLN